MAPLRDRPSHRQLRIVSGVLAALVVAVAACGGDDDEAANENGEVESVEVVLGWLAEPSRGGLYAAEQAGLFADAGIEADLNAGTDVSAIQLVGAGRAQFGIGDADELLTARQQGVPVVAVATTFQTSPRILVYHAENPVRDFDDLNGRTVYLDLGDDWWEWVKAEFELDVSERAYTGQLANFITDKEALVQGYLGSEDVVLTEQGVDVGYLNVGESGFNPYTNVLFTTESLIEEQPELVREMVRLFVEGWELYREDYADVNEFMQAFNEELTVESMNQTAEAQFDAIYGADAAEHGIGFMSPERWSTLEAQLRDLGVLESEVDISEVLNTEFLPESN
jgi:NitT/TauT family transport system substrate-binding protein